jgi:hypothetical protein
MIVDDRGDYEHGERPAENAVVKLPAFDRDVFQARGADFLDLFRFQKPAVDDVLDIRINKVVADRRIGVADVLHRLLSEEKNFVGVDFLEIFPIPF